MWREYNGLLLSFTPYHHKLIFFFLCLGFQLSRWLRLIVVWSNSKQIDPDQSVSICRTPSKHNYKLLDCSMVLLSHRAVLQDNEEWSSGQRIDYLNTLILPNWIADYLFQWCSSYWSHWELFCFCSGYQKDIDHLRSYSLRELNA